MVGGGNVRGCWFDLTRANMDFQTGFNIVIGIVGFLGGFILNTIWQSLKDLQKADKELIDRVHEVETLVAGQYVKRDEFAAKIEAMFAKLDRIEEKIDRKADKGEHQ